MTAASITPTIVISIPDAHQERRVISDFTAPTTKCATMLTAKAAITAGIPVMKKNGIIGMKAPIPRWNGSGSKGFPDWGTGAPTAQTRFCHRLCGCSVAPPVVRPSSETRAEPLELIEKRHFLDFFVRTFFDLGFFSRDFRFVNFSFTFHCEISAGPHRQRGSNHARETGNENDVLLIVCGSGHTGKMPKTAPSPSFTP